MNKSQIHINPGTSTIKGATVTFGFTDFELSRSDINTALIEFVQRRHKKRTETFIRPNQFGQNKP